MAFTAHNVLLPDGTYTFPEVGVTMERFPWYLAAIRIMRTVFPNGVEGRSLVDLGCLEGGYTLEFAKAGLDALGIEVRQNNFDNCQTILKAFKLSNLRFVKDDVWNCPVYGAHDITFCCGLLYHLDRPKQFLEMIGPLTRKLLIVQTHFADDEVAPEFGMHLSNLVVHEGLVGRWYREYDGQFQEAEVEQMKWTSWRNSRSFWPTRPSLFQAISDAGFDVVLEQIDPLGPDIVAAMGPEGVYGKKKRGTFVGIKS